MPKIACLAWGSLVWDPKDLPIRTQWFSDGPFVHVEFARESQDGRISLVLCDGVKQVQSLWAEMSCTTLEEAKEALRKREKTITKNIGYWERGKSEPKLIDGLPKWAISVGVDAIIWTALRPKFDEKENIPSVDMVINRLKSLNGAVKDEAEKYFRNAPAQVDTEYRRKVAKELGWK